MKKVHVEEFGYNYQRKYIVERGYRIEAGHAFFCLFVF